MTYLAKPDPQEEDLKKTAIDIALSFGQEMASYISDFEEIARKYYSFKNLFKQMFPNDDEFYGTRDFFCCVKLICSMIKAKGLVSDSLDAFIEEAVARNFGEFQNKH